MLEQAKIDKLLEIGNEWEDFGKHRIYFNDLESRLGLDVSYYKSGNVSGATQNGERISNSEAKRILGRLAGAKIFFDLKSGEFTIQYGELHSEEEDRIINSIKEQAQL